jgi:predicted Zn-dependent protease
MRAFVILVGVLVTIGVPRIASAQFGIPKQLPGGLGSVLQKADEFVFTDEEEAQIGAAISEKLRNRFGVVQDPAIHRYVTLVGRLLAQASPRPNLPWTFVVLDSEGINAFAAPGGYIHITRGALTFIQSEAELAGVLGHEISHVTEKHTLAAIRKAQGMKMASNQVRSAVVAQAAEVGFNVILENAWGRKEEMESDRDGVQLANRLGYAPTGLSAFLERLDVRNKDRADKDPKVSRSGPFASHPETTARLEGISKTIKQENLSASASVAPRFMQAVSAMPAMAAGGIVTPAARPGAGTQALDAITSPTATLTSLAPTEGGAANQRNVNPERDAPHGSTPTAVLVMVTDADLASFKAAITP